MSKTAFFLKEAVAESQLLAECKVSICVWVRKLTPMQNNLSNVRNSCWWGCWRSCWQSCWQSCWWCNVKYISRHVPLRFVNAFLVFNGLSRILDGCFDKCEPLWLHQSLAYGKSVRTERFDFACTALGSTYRPKHQTADPYTGSAVQPY